MDSTKPVAIILIVFFMALGGFLFYAFTEGREGCDARYYFFASRISYEVIQEISMPENSDTVSILFESGKKWIWLNEEVRIKKVNHHFQVGDELFKRKQHIVLSVFRDALNEKGESEPRSFITSINFDSVFVCK